MEGVHILNKIPILEVLDWLSIAICVCSVVAAMSLTLSIILGMVLDKGKLAFSISMVIFVLTSISILVFGTMTEKCKKQTGKYKYECTVDKSVSFEELTDNYEIVDQRGDIWVLKDKE